MFLPIALRYLWGMSRGNPILWFLIVTLVRSEYIQQPPADHRFSHVSLQPGTLDVFLYRGHGIQSIRYSARGSRHGGANWRVRSPGGKFQPFL